MARSQQTIQNVQQFIGSSIIIEDSVAKMPGIGPRIRLKLEDLNIFRISDLYEKYLDLNCDEIRFRAWMLREVSPRTRVPVIYDCLRGWHTQFGDGYVRQSASSANGTATPRVAARLAPRRRSTRSAAPATRAAGNTRAGGPLRSRRSRDSAQNDDIIPQPNNPLMMFFASFSDSYHQILPELHSQFKRKILDVVAEFEEISRERRNTASGATATGS